MHFLGDLKSGKFTSYLLGSGEEEEEEEEEKQLGTP